MAEKTDEKEEKGSDSKKEEPEVIKNVMGIDLGYKIVDCRRR